MRFLNLGCPENITSSGMKRDREAPSVGLGVVAGEEKSVHPNLRTSDAVHVSRGQVHRVAFCFVT